MYNSYDVSSNFDKIIYIKDSLCIETYIIGYKSEGESILFFVLADGDIRFSGAVDCFFLDNINFTEKILSCKGNITLDFLCWTHPDMDHSKGIDHLIENYTDKHTKIWIPEYVDLSKATCSSTLSKFFEQLKNIVVVNRYDVHSVSDKKDLMYYESYCFKKGTEVFPLNITSYAPNSSIVRLMNYKEKDKTNLYSVFLEISIKNTNILLTGDALNDTIKEIPGHCFKKHIHILKIPHHGSDTSSALYDTKNIKNIDVSCATVFRIGRSSLPLDNVMNEYKKRSERVYCTGKKDPLQEKKKYGVVKISTDVLKNKYRVKKIGNADLW